MAGRMSARWMWEHCLRSTTLGFFFSAAVLLGSVATLFAWLTFSPFPRPIASVSSSSTAALGCRPDGEGSWSIGIFYGDSPFSLKAIESVRIFSFFFSLFVFKAFFFSLVWILIGIWVMGTEECMEERKRSVAGGESCVYVRVGFGCWISEQFCRRSLPLYPGE